MAKRCDIAVMNVLVIEYWNLEFICYLILEIWNFIVSHPFYNHLWVGSLHDLHELLEIRVVYAAKQVGLFTL